MGNGQSSIIAKAVNKQYTSNLLLYKLYFKMILKMILKSFEFQCDFDFQVTTSKMILILILNHLYLGDLILILKSSTYDDFAHLCKLLICNFNIKNTEVCMYPCYKYCFNKHCCNNRST